MIVVLLMLIVFILLFGAGVVKGWLTNIVGVGVGGLILLVLALKLGSYFGEYGLLWVIGGVVAVVALSFAVGIHFEDKARDKMLSEDRAKYERLLDSHKPDSYPGEADRFMQNLHETDPTRHHGKWDRPGDFDGNY